MYHPRFKGDHYDIGLKYGRLLKKKNVELFGLMELNSFQFNYGATSERILRRCFPEACEEIRGLADGMNLSYQKFSAWLMCISVCLEIPGCTMVAFKKEGRVVFGRNNDLPPVFQKISASALYAPSNGYSFIANSSAFVSAEEGINEKGLSIGMTYVWAKQLEAGLNSMFLVRYILERCATVREAVGAIQQLPIGGAYHLILADREDMAHVECSPQKTSIRRGDVAVASNHFISQEMKIYEEPKNLYRSYDRCKTGEEALNTRADTLTAGYVKDILRGKLGFMCQYEKVLNFDTVWSSVYDVSNRKVYRAEGNPGRKKYKEDIRLSFNE